MNIRNDHRQMQALDKIQVLWRDSGEEPVHGAQRGECKAVFAVQQPNCFFRAVGYFSIHDPSINWWILLTFAGRKGKCSGRSPASKEELAR